MKQLTIVCSSDLADIVGELTRYIGDCDVEPCLRLLVAPLESVY